MTPFNALPSSALSLPNRRGEAVFWRVYALSWQSSYSADMLWTGWILNPKWEAFISVSCLCCGREAIILSPAGGMSKFQLCSALSNLLSLMLIIFLLASTLWGEANNTVFVLQRLCTSMKWCWHNPSLQIPFLLQQPTDCLLAVISCCPGKMHGAGREIGLVDKCKLKMGGVEGSTEVGICFFKC